MKRIATLNGMGWLVLSLIFQTSHTAAVAAQEINEATSLIQRTYWTGRIEQNTIWHDTVYVIGDVTIASGATLTLAPDTQVHFLPYRDDTQSGLDSTRTELIVEGRLHAQAEGIVFCSANAASLGSDWYGIVVERGGLADVSNATIRDGLRCLYAKRGGRVTMDHVTFANCGKPTSASQNSTGLPKVLVRRAHREEGAGERIVKKLWAGGLGGIGGGLVGVGGGIYWGLNTTSDCSSAEACGDGIGGEFYSVLGFWGGNVVGTAVGVSLVDSQNNFFVTLAGSALLGAGVPYAIVLTEWEYGVGLVVLSAFLGPIVGATLASEKWRKPLSAKLHLKPEARQVSIGLVPAPKRGLSAIATLRF